MPPKDDSLRAAAYVSYMREEKMRELRAFGYNNQQIANILGTTKYKVVKAIGKGHITKKRQFLYNASDEANTKAREICKSIGLITKTGPNTGEGSIGHLVEALAAGVVHVTRDKSIEEDSEWIHLPSLPREASEARTSDGGIGKILEGSLPWQPGVLSLADEGATGSGETGTEGLLPEHRKALHGGDE